jgi:hypothetical protein
MVSRRHWSRVFYLFTPVKAIGMHSGSDVLPVEWDLSEAVAGQARSEFLGRSAANWG